MPLPAPFPWLPAVQRLVSHPLELHNHLPGCTVFSLAAILVYSFQSLCFHFLTFLAVSSAPNFFILLWIFLKFYQVVFINLKQFLVGFELLLIALCYFLLGVPPRSVYLLIPFASNFTILLPIYLKLS